MAKPRVDKVVKGNLVFHDHGIEDMPTTDLDARYLNESANLSDVDDAATARTNLGLVAGGAGDIWVEKAGDTMTGPLVITPSANGTSIFNVTNQAGASVLNVDTTNARVGIGTTSPAQKLDINGSIAIAGRRMFHDAETFNSLTGSLIVGNGGASLTAGGTDNGLYNTFVGIGAGLNSTTARYNTIVGNNAFYNNTTGFSNTALGAFALFTNTTGGINVALGREALYLNQSGGSNSAFGYAALYKNTSGSFNMAIGRQAMYENLSGGYNSAIGYQSLYYNTTGTYNTAITSQALLACTTGSHNLALGYQAGRYQADGSTALQTPNNSLYLGAYTRGKDNNDNNSVVIGYQAIGLGANTVVIGSSSITLTAVQGDLALGTTSPSAKIHAIKTTEQQRLGYDASNYFSTTVASTGSTTFDLVAGSGTPIFTFSDQVLVADKLIFTQTDGNEYIDSLADGYLDYRATTAHRFGDGTNQLVIDADGDLILEGTAKYERHVQIPAVADGLPANQPADVDFFTAGGLQYASSGTKYAYCQWEIPDDWDGTDIVFEVDWFPDSGAISGTDAVRWTVEYRAIAEGETINNGTSVTVDNGAGGDTADYSQYQTKHTRFTLAYNNANQPLTNQDHVFFKISRDTSVANDFAGTVTVTAYEIIYQSKGFPSSN